MSMSKRHPDFPEKTLKATLTGAPIQSLWIGDLGPLERLCMASFLENGHEYHLYTYDELHNVPAGVQIKDANEIIPRERIFTYSRGKERGGYSGFADLFRYKLLAEKGGWWVDTDMICLRHFTSEGEYVLASEKKRPFGRKICIAVMAGPKGAAFFQDCYEAADAHDPATLRFAENGEPIVQKQVKTHGLQSAIAAPQRYNPINWWQSEMIGKPGTERLLEDMQDGLHCYAESWRWRMRDRSGMGGHADFFAPDTLLGALQRRYLKETA